MAMVLAIFPSNARRARRRRRRRVRSHSGSIFTARACAWALWRRRRTGRFPHRVPGPSWMALSHAGFSPTLPSRAKISVPAEGFKAVVQHLQITRSQLESLINARKRREADPMTSALKLRQPPLEVTVKVRRTRDT